MAYDRTAYFENRAAARNEKLAEERYQRDLARARTGEAAAAHREGVAAQGLASAGNPAAPEIPASGFLNTGAIRSRETTVGTPAPLATAEDTQPSLVTAAPPPPEPIPITYEEETPKPMARGGRFNPDEPLRVGEHGPEVIVPRRGGTVIPNNALSGFRNTGAIRNLARLGPTAPEASITGHLIDERKQAGTNLAHLQAADITGKRHVESAGVTGQAHVEGARAMAEPNLIQANVIRTKAEREHMTQLNAEREAEYNRILANMDATWPTAVAKMEADYRAKHGQDMSPEMRGTILNVDPKTKIAFNRDLGTPEHNALLSMGLPKEGEAVRPGQLIANGYESQKDGSWQKVAVNPISGTKYLDKFVPGAEGLTRREEMIKPERKQGPGMYREDGRWYGSRTSSPQQIPPKVLTIEQALNPRVVESYNQRADKFNMPQIGADLIQQNPDAAAWQILTGVNTMNTRIGKNIDDHRHLNAPTYVLNDEDTKKAVAAHANWLNPSTAPPTAPAGTPPATTPDIIRAAAAATAAGTPGPSLAAAPAPAAVAPEALVTGGAGEIIPPAAPAVAPKMITPAGSAHLEAVPEDPALRNWQAVGRTVESGGRTLVNAMTPFVRGAKETAETALYPIRRGLEGAGSLVVQGARQVVPGAYKVFNEPTPENPLGLQNVTPPILAAPPERKLEDIRPSAM